MSQRPNNSNNEIDFSELFKKVSHPKAYLCVVLLIVFSGFCGLFGILGHEVFDLASVMTNDQGKLLVIFTLFPLLIASFILVIIGCYFMRRMVFNVELVKRVKSNMQEYRRNREFYDTFYTLIRDIRNKNWK